MLRVLANAIKWSDAFIIASLRKRIFMEEIWKDIVGYEGFYQVSNLGRVRSLDRYIEVTNKRGTLYRRPIKGKLLSLNSTDDDYISVALTKDNITIFPSIHRLVAQAFIPNPDNLPMVNHKDESRTNNCVDNLEWCTAKYNSNYGMRRERISKSLSGRILSDEWCRKISESHSGINNPMYGRKHTEEWKQEQSKRMSEQRKGKPAWNKGKTGVQVPWNKGRQGVQVAWNKGLKKITLTDGTTTYIRP